MSNPAQSTHPSAGDWLAWLLSCAPRTPIVSLPTREAHGHVLAETVRSPHPLPLFANSAMDGYALHSADVAAASDGSPVSLRVLGEVAAGSGEDPALPRGSCVRIMTGAAVPSDADAVVPVERTMAGGGASVATITGAGTARADTIWADETVQVLRAVPAGANIRLTGEDTPRDAVLAEAGEGLTAARLASLAAAGVAQVRVHALPRVAVVVTGSELCEPGVQPSRGQIPESNSILISGMLRELGIEEVAVQHSRDDAAGLGRLVARLAEQCDFIITTGGIGPGRHDVVRIALEQEPAVRGVHLAMKPGAPQRAGMLASGAFVLALPGNPVSAAVSFEMFVRPVLLAAQGCARTQRLRLSAAASEAWHGAPGRLQVLPVRVFETPDGLACTPVVNPRGVAHAVGGHGSADGYALVEEERGDIAQGESVQLILVAP